MRNNFSIKFLGYRLFVWLVMALAVIPFAISVVFLFVGKLLVSISEFLKLNISKGKRDLHDAFKLYN